MKKIINKKIYNTKTAKKLGKFSNMNDRNNFYYYSEELYQTKKGQYFLHGKGNAASPYSITNGNNSSENEDIILLSKNEAIKWLEDKTLVDELEEYFLNELEEG